METIISEPELEHAGFQWRESEGVRGLVCTALQRAGFPNAFSTRSGGVSAMPENSLNLAGFNEDSAENILENRRRFLKLFPGDWVLAGCWQVHGADVRKIETAADARPATDAHGDTIYCDAIVSDVPGVLAGVKTADCVPILMGDPKSGAFAAVHAGWRGTVAKVAVKALERMAKDFGVASEEVVVAIGPAAGSCCYEVGADVINQFNQNFREAELFHPTRDGHASVDLIKANRIQLTNAGICDQNIHAAPLCTMCRTNLFFSYRREKALYGKVGRLMSVIGRTPTERSATS
ncbi:MAG TPA: peptidoglycan editing factor PgeF [Pyrinomonadaceae bacterium]|nr:peptidoglycan editing factor PgeF [Pyrinomonadaceae bacterium]